LHRLKLDQVWWLVSPQNPLKSRQEMAPLAQRLAGAEKIAAHPRIKVSALEDRIGTRYTADTARKLRLHYPQMRFVWLMGADNLAQMRHWQDWRSIASMLPIAVLDRPGYGLPAAQGLVAKVLAPHRLGMADAAALASQNPPAFVYLKSKLNPLSATALRRAGKAYSHR